MSTKEESGLPNPGRSLPNSDSDSTAFTVEQKEALRIAHAMVDAGVPVFVAAKNHGDRGPEFLYPRGWEHAAPDHREVDRWRPGWALCAVMGVVADVLDTDPRNGGDAGRELAIMSGQWPRTFGRAHTPSGGTHELISRTHMKKGEPWPGVDLQAGDDSGEGRGFVYIAPTVREAKGGPDKGRMVAYRWVDEPDLATLQEFEHDPSVEGVCAALSAKRTRPAATPAPAQDDPFVTASQVVARGSAATVHAQLAQLRQQIADAPEGAGNNTIARVGYKAGQYVGAGQLSEQQAFDTLVRGMDGWEFHGKGRGEQENTLRAQIRAGALAPRAWSEGTSAGVSAEVTEEPTTRVVDLAPFLDGTYKPPQPSVGAPRSDGKHLLYPGRWHTVIGPTGTGKSFYALLHCIAEMQAGNKVIYAHFEESSPGGTLERLRAMAPELPVTDILERFVWVDCNRRWQDGEFAALAASVGPSLVVLDGINRAATQHGLDPSHIEAPGKYAGQFVACCTALGATVLSLGHPPKARGRETERHGFGATGWLDDVEGVGFRLVPSQKRIREDSSGYAMLYSVKDRYGQVERGEEPADGKDMDGWMVLGAFWVDSTTPGVSRCGIKLPEADETGSRRDKFDVLGDAISNILRIRGTFDSVRDMQNKLTAHGVKFTNGDVSPALERLCMAGLIDWPEVGERKPRPGVWKGSLTDPESFMSPP